MRAAYEKVLADDSENPRVLHLLGLLVQQEGQTAKAAELFENAIRHDSFNSYYHNDLGTVLEDLGRLDQALVSYHKALKINPEYPAGQEFR